MGHNQPIKSRSWSGDERRRRVMRLSVFGGMLLVTLLFGQFRSAVGQQRQYRTRNAPNTSGRQNMNSFRNNFFQPYNQNQQPYYPQNNGPYYNNQQPYNQQGQPVYSNPNYGQPITYPDPPIAPRVYSNLPIEIRCRKQSEGTASYSLISGSGKVYNFLISPGQKQELKENTDWKIRYEVGSGQGTKTYRLRGGKSYELRSEAGGRWAFYMDP